MVSAKYYIYRNLHIENTFSIRFRGRVIDRQVNMIAHDVQFKVNLVGRARALQTGHRNVHAFIATELYEPSQSVSLGLTRVSYNPFKSPTFEVNGVPIYMAKEVLFSGGQCFILKY